MQDIHIHLHPGVTPEVATAAVLAAKVTGPPPIMAEENDGHTQPDPFEPDRDEFEEYVRRFYTETWDDGDAKPMLEYLADHPGQAISYPEINGALGYSSRRSLPGLLGSIGKRANHRYRGFKPFEVIKVDGSDEWHMVMTPEAAEIINKLR